MAIENTVGEEGFIKDDKNLISIHSPPTPVHFYLLLALPTNPLGH